MSEPKVKTPGGQEYWFAVWDRVDELVKSGSAKAVDVLQDETTGLITLRWQNAEGVTERERIAVPS